MAVSLNDKFNIIKQNSFSTDVDISKNLGNILYDIVNNQENISKQFISNYFYSLDNQVILDNSIPDLFLKIIDQNIKSQYRKLKNDLSRNKLKFTDYNDYLTNLKNVINTVNNIMRIIPSSEVYLKLYVETGNIYSLIENSLINTTITKYLVKNNINEIHMLKRFYYNILNLSNKNSFYEKDTVSTAFYKKLITDTIISESNNKIVQKIDYLKELQKLTNIYEFYKNNVYKLNFIKGLNISIIHHIFIILNNIFKDQSIKFKTIFMKKYKNIFIDCIKILEFKETNINDNDKKIISSCQELFDMIIFTFNFENDNISDLIEYFKFVLNFSIKLDLLNKVSICIDKLQVNDINISKLLTKNYKVCIDMFNCDLINKKQIKEFQIYQLIFNKILKYDNILYDLEKNLINRLLNTTENYIETILYEKNVFEYIDNYIKNNISLKNYGKILNDFDDKFDNMIITNSSYWNINYTDGFYEYVDKSNEKINTRMYSDLVRLTRTKLDESDQKVRFLLHLGYYDIDITFNNCKVNFILNPLQHLVYQFILDDIPLEQIFDLIPDYSKFIINNVIKSLVIGNLISKNHTVITYYNKDSSESVNLIEIFDSLNNMEFKDTKQKEKCLANNRDDILSTVINDIVKNNDTVRMSELYTMCCDKHLPFQLDQKMFNSTFHKMIKMKYIQNKEHLVTKVYGYG